MSLRSQFGNLHTRLLCYYLIVYLKDVIYNTLIFEFKNKLMANIRENGSQRQYHEHIKVAYDAAKLSDVVLVDLPNASVLAGPVTRLLAANRIDIPVSGVEFAGQAWLDFLNYKRLSQSTIQEIFSNPTLSDNLRQEYREWLVMQTKNVDSGDNSLGGRIKIAGEIIRNIPANITPKIVGITALPLEGQSVAVDDFMQVTAGGRKVELQSLPLLSGGLEIDGVKAATIFDYSANDQGTRTEQRKFLRHLVAGA